MSFCDVLICVIDMFGWEVSIGVCLGCILLFLRFFSVVLRDPWGHVAGGLIFPDILVSSEWCSCGAVGFPLRAERKLGGRRSFPVFRGAIKDGIVLRSSFFDFF